MDHARAITVIVPTFRRPALLERAVRSVLAQTHPDLVVAIYDNASGDGTREVCERLAKEDPRVRYHEHRENIGAGANFQYGLERVATPYFAFLSDDDALLP
jgi:glycosyltransferase involved in cell wall biosynthesis